MSMAKLYHKVLSIVKNANYSRNNCFLYNTSLNHNLYNTLRKIVFILLSGIIIKHDYPIKLRVMEVTNMMKKIESLRRIRKQLKGLRKDYKDCRECRPRDLQDARMTALDDALEMFAKKNNLISSWDAWWYFNNNYPASIIKKMMIFLTNVIMSIILICESPAPEGSVVMVLGLLLINLIISRCLSKTEADIDSLGFKNELLKEYPRWKIRKNTKDESGDSEKM